MTTNSILVYDCETKTFGKPDPDKDKLKVFGCYSYKTKKYYISTSIIEMQKIINNHKFLIGFNNLEYDNPIMVRAGIEFKFKTFIDLRQIFKKRASQMKIKKGMLGDLLMEYSLDYITRMLDLVSEEEAKLKIDYNIFKKESWTKEEKKLIYDYTKRDIEVTKKLYEWLENYFDSFKHFLNEKDINKKIYLTCSIAVFAYKTICKAMNWDEIYNDNERDESFPGGYVAYPAGEKFEGDIAMFDFSSLYPNIFIQANLFGTNCKCCNINEKWNGDGFFKVEGFYCKKQLSPLSNLLKQLYLQRVEFKKNKDPREYSLKIILNSTYGAVSNASFAKIFNLTAATDCTSLGRQMIKYVRKRFKQNGYINIMSDTDSAVVKFPKDKTKNDAIELANKIVDELQQYLPFPW